MLKAVKVVALFISIGLTIYQTGCASGNLKATPTLHQNNSIEHQASVASFHKLEVLTRQWTGPDGMVISLLDLHFYEIKGRHAIAIAKYGNKQNGRVYCADIYQCEKAVQPEDVILTLLCHDARSGWIIDISPEERAGHVFLNITRDSLDSGTGRTFRNSYSYQYDKDNGFSNTTGDFYSETKD